jgi:hypothetical protein
MREREEIDQYDLVQVIQIPEQYLGVIDIGDVGTVVEKYDAENFEVECVQPGGFTKWLVTLNIDYLSLRSKDPYHSWIEKTLTEKPIMQTSLRLGIGIGAVFGGLMGAGAGTITRTLNGSLIGLLIGVGLGMITGAFSAALTVKTAGTTGGIGVGYFTGMVVGGAFGMLLGALIPTSLLMSIHGQGLPVLDELTVSRFETVMHIGFLFSVLGAMVGTWVGGKNQIPRNLKERYRS